jgi:hypothetical protein
VDEAGASYGGREIITTSGDFFYDYRIFFNTINGIWQNQNTSERGQENKISFCNLFHLMCRQQLLQRYSSTRE